MEREGKLNAAIVGYGFIGQMHKEVLRDDSRINRISVVDIDWEKRAKAEAEGLDTFSDLSALLDNQPDILITALPPSGNLEAVNRIIASGKRPKALLIEKPLATTLTDAAKIDRALRATDTVSMVGLTGHGFHPEFRRAREILQSGAIGEAHSFLENIHFGGPGLPPQHLTRAYGGVILENGIHSLDHLFYLSGSEDWRIAEAESGNDHWQAEVADWAEVTLGRERQMSHLSWLWPKAYATELEDYQATIVGTKGRLTVYGFDGVRLQTADGVQEEHFHSQDTPVDRRHLPGLRAELDAFIKSIGSGQSPVPVRYALKLHTLLEHIERS